VQKVRSAMDHKVPARSAEAQALAARWMALLAEDTEVDQVLSAKLHRMHVSEPAMQERTGISLEMVAYVMAAANERKLAIYAKYLSPEELDYLRANFGKRANEWPGLIGEVRAQMEQGTPPDAPAMRQLALRWIDLFQSYAGTNPQTHAKMRQAMEREPALLSGPWGGPDMIAYMREAMALLQAA
jgi:hypothetical protein